MSVDWRCLESQYWRMAGSGVHRYVCWDEEQKRQAKGEDRKSKGVPSFSFPLLVPISAAVVCDEMSPGSRLYGFNGWVQLLVLWKWPSDSWKSVEIWNDGWEKETFSCEMSYVVKCVNPFLSSPMRKSQRLSRGRRVEANGKTPPVNVITSIFTLLYNTMKMV